MPTSMQDWRSTAMEQYKNLGVERLSHYEFLRDPPRVQRIDSRFFFSPVDGIIIGQSRVSPDDDLIETKGTKCTVSELMKPWPIETPCLCISVFLTFYDVHIVRCPTGAMLSHQYVGPVRTMNLPMLFEEQSICRKGRVSSQDLRYMATNGRVLCKFASTNLAYRYYMVLLSDSDVSAIMPFDPRPRAALAQGERCFAVRWGSQCTLVLPLDPRYRFKPLAKISDHVEAGVDPLVRIERRT